MDILNFKVFKELRSVEMRKRVHYHPSCTLSIEYNTPGICIQGDPGFSSKLYRDRHTRDIDERKNERKKMQMSGLCSLSTAAKENQEEILILF